MRRTESLRLAEVAGRLRLGDKLLVQEWCRCTERLMGKSYLLHRGKIDCFELTRDLVRLLHLLNYTPDDIDKDIDSEDHEQDDE